MSACAATVANTTSANASPPLSRNLEGVRLIWFDRTIDRTDDTKRTIEKLHKVSDYVALFTDWEEYSRENAAFVEKQLETFSFFDQHPEKSIRNLSKQSAEFLWFQIFKDVIMRMPHDSHAKRQMVQFCKNYYYGDHEQQLFIEEFEQDYRPDNSIKWYTKETFLYKLVNKALRTEDIEHLHIFRFFISDLSLSLSAEYEKIRSNKDTIILYRGQKMDPIELLSLQENHGNLIAANGFLSASRSEQLAIEFAIKPTKRSNVLSVLYEIECNVKSTIFADVAQFSDYPKESEVLFDFGSTFRFISVTEDKQSKLWKIKMNATDEGAAVMKEYIELYRKDESEISIEMIFGKLLLEMGKYDQSIKHFQTLLNDSAHKEHKAWIYNLIGAGYHCKYELEKAFENYRHCFLMIATSVPLPVHQSIRPLANMGLINHQRKDYNGAMDTYSKVLEIAEICYGKYHLKTTKILTNIGSIYVELKQYERALKTYKNVLEIQQKDLLTNHIDIAMTLNNIGVVYHKLGQKDRALEYYRKSLAMKQILLPPEHKDIRLTKNNIEDMNEPRYQFALHFGSAEDKMPSSYDADTTNKPSESILHDIDT
ncbi:unnamed protein product [Adineta steineri]|uniref:ADP ribosyltransferase domain-containing protein n=1 Tax=Adineta steineri TaxID=433720 RepID=A0A815HBP9_9BILA|nr:unnamed protein product [Adineta steineri]CAF1545373.1 unnamed protein product [Adineta steineri]